MANASIYPLKLRLPFVCALIVSATAATGLSWALPTPASELTRQLRMVIRTDKEKYSDADEINLEVAIHNDGFTTVFLARDMEWGYVDGLQLVTMNEEGDRVRGNVLPDALPPPPSLDDKHVLLPLRPACFHGQRLQESPKALLPGPGKYSIHVEYRSQLMREFVAPDLRELPAVWRDSPELVSNTISITWER